MGGRVSRMVPAAIGGLLCLCALVFFSHSDPLSLFTLSSNVDALSRSYPLKELAFDSMMSRRPLNLIFEMDIRPVDRGGLIYEHDWIRHVVLGGLNRPIRTWVFTEGPTAKMNDSLLVFLFKPRGGTAFFKEMRQEGYANMGGYHMGNEMFDQDTGFYGDTDYMFHNYYDARMEPNSMFIPLGLKAGLCHLNPTTFLPVNQRKHVCSFVGSIDSIRANRQEMLTTFEAAGVPCLVKADFHWGDPSQLTTVEYTNILLESIFVLAAWGNIPESMRPYEALDAGAVPIFHNYSVVDPDKDFVRHGLPGCPCPVVNDWEEGVALVQSLLQDERTLLKLQSDSIEWWASFKKRLREDVRAKVDEAFAD